MKAQLTLGYAAHRSLDGGSLPVMFLSACTPVTVDFVAEEKYTFAADKMQRATLVRIAPIDGPCWILVGRTADNPTAAVDVGTYFFEGFPEFISILPGDTISLCPA